MIVGLSIPYIDKIAIYKYWHNCAKQKYGDRVKLCYKVTDTFKVHIKSENAYADFIGDTETKFDTSNYEVVIPLHIGINKKEIGLTKDKLDE